MKRCSQHSSGSAPPQSRLSSDDDLREESARPDKRRRCGLQQVYPRVNGETEPDVDIIAVHGLDAHSPETWTWVDKNPSGETKKPPVNWLADANMLPSEVGRARIFTCDWPGDMYRPVDMVKTKIDELARRLLGHLANRPPATLSDANPNERPILFIASCLGGLILAKALVMAKDEQPQLIAAVRGVVFLATPFGGTSFGRVSAWVIPLMQAIAMTKGQRLTPHIEDVGDSTFDLAEIVSKFTGLCNKLSFQISCCYELRDTDLAAKAPFLGTFFGPGPKPVSSGDIPACHGPVSVADLELPTAGRSELWRIAVR